MFLNSNFGIGDGFPIAHKEIENTAYSAYKCSHNFCSRKNASKLDWILNKLYIMDFLAKLSDKILT
jgi:hypothetical protein